MLEVKQIFKALWHTCRFKRDSLQICTQNIFDAQGFILAQDIIATRPIPPFDNSAMDGYAVCLNDAGKEVYVVGRTLAGESKTESILQNGMCQKVMTGSPIPQGAQAVVPIEYVTSINKNILLPSEIKHSQNIRFMGEEIALDSVILPQRSRLKPLDLGLLASQGLSHIQVYKKLSIALFSSGDEVVEPGTQALPHQIYNTNAISIYSILRQYHYNPTYQGILPDDAEVLRSKLRSLNTYDIVVTTGGASVGDADLLKSTLSELGAQFIFDGVNLKPGKHLSVAILNETIFIMLPGNPLASLLHLYTLILSFLEFCSGAHKCYLKAYRAQVDSEIMLKNSVQTLLLGNFHNGIFHIFNKGKFGSSALINVWKNNAIALIDKNYGMIESQSYIQCISFNNEFEEECHFINTKEQL